MIGPLKVQQYTFRSWVSIQACKPTKSLDGRSVPTIHANLSSGVAIGEAIKLHEMEDIQHEADKKARRSRSPGERRTIFFQYQTPPDAARVTCAGRGPTVRTSPQRSKLNWIIDFPPNTNLEMAASYDAAFAYVQKEIAPQYAHKRKAWWIHERPRPAMRSVMSPLSRYLATPILTKYRLFVWLKHDVLPDHQLVVFARQDDYFFGALDGSIHELWARRTGTQLREAESGFRYTPTTCFETFPLPGPPARKT